MTMLVYFLLLAAALSLGIAAAAWDRARRSQLAADGAANLAQQADDRVTRAFDSLCTLSDAVLILRQHRAEDVASIADLSIKVVEHDDRIGEIAPLRAEIEITTGRITEIEALLAAEEAAASLTAGDRKYTGDCRDAHPDGTASVFPAELAEARPAFLSADQRHERDRERYNARQDERRAMAEAEDKWALGRAEADKGQC